MNRLRCLATCALVALAGCTSTNGGEPTPDEEYAALWPQEALDQFEAPTGVLVWRITPSIDVPEDEQREDLHGHAYKAGPVSVLDGEGLGEPWLDRLRAILEDEGSYGFELAKGCIFAPGFMVQIEGAGGSLDVLLCFRCEELERVWTGEARGEYFDPVTPQLWELMRQVFPDDPVFKSD